MGAMDYGRLIYCYRNFLFVGTLRNIEKSREIKLVLLFSLGFFDYFCMLIKNASNTKSNSLYDVFF